MIKKLLLILLFTLLTHTAFAGVTFDGVDDFIPLANESNFDFERTQAFTISLWSKLTANNEVHDIIAKMSDANLIGWCWVNNFNYISYAQSNGYISFMLSSAWTTNAIAVSTTDVSTKVNDGTWHNYIVTYSGSSLASGLTIYEDGTSLPFTVKYDTLSTTMLNNEPVTVGARTDGGTLYHEVTNGSISEVAIWDVVLTASEMALLTNSRIKGIPLQIRTSALKLYLPMDDQEAGTSADGDTVRDYSGLGNNGIADNGIDNLGLFWVGESILNYPSSIISQ